MTISLAHQIAEVEREIAMRERVYPGLIVRGKMRPGEAGLHTERMRAVLETLRGLQSRTDAYKAMTYYGKPIPELDREMAIRMFRAMDSLHVCSGFADAMMALSTRLNELGVDVNELLPRKQHENGVGRALGDVP